MYLGYASKLPANLILLQGVVIFLEFLQSRHFLVSGFDYGSSPADDRLRSANTAQFSTQQNISRN